MRLAARTDTTSGVVSSTAQVGRLDGGGVGGVELGAAVDDDDVVARPERADDLPRGPVVDLLAALALAGREQQARAPTRGV